MSKWLSAEVVYAGFTGHKCQAILFLILSIDILRCVSYCLSLNAPKAMIDYSRFS